MLQGVRNPDIRLWLLFSKGVVLPGSTFLAHGLHLAGRKGGLSMNEPIVPARARVPVPEKRNSSEKRSSRVVFDHEKLDSYRVSVRFVGVTEKIVKNLPEGRSYITNQLLRAALSIPLNIAEGSGEYSRRDKARFYRFALRSATECAAVLDVLLSTDLGDAEVVEEGRELLHRIVSMLVRMVKGMGGGGQFRERERERS